MTLMKRATWEIKNTLKEDLTKQETPSTHREKYRYQM